MHSFWTLLRSNRNYRYTWLGQTIRDVGDHFTVEQVLARCDPDTGSQRTAAQQVELVLKAQGITHLLFSGATTDVCVHTTLREATDRKYQCLLVEDACASCDAYAHEAAIHMVTVEDGIFGVVATVDSVIAGLAAAPPAE